MAGSNTNALCWAGGTGGAGGASGGGEVLVCGAGKGWAKVREIKEGRRQGTKKEEDTLAIHPKVPGGAGAIKGGRQRDAGSIVSAGEACTLVTISAIEISIIGPRGIVWNWTDIVVANIEFLQTHGL